MKKTVRVIVSVILVVLTVFGLIGLCGAALVNSLLHEKQFYRTAESSGWAAGVREKIAADFAALSDVTDIPQDVTDAFLREKVTDEVCMRFWTGKPADFPEDDLKRDLVARIRLCAEEMREKGEIAVSDEDWAMMESYFPETADYYVSAVRRDVFLNGLGSVKTAAADYWQRLSLPILAACAVLTVVSAAVLILINRKKLLQTGYAVLTPVGLTLLIPAIWLKVSDFAVRFQVTPAYLKNFIEAYYATAVSRLLITGSVLLALGIACCVGAAATDIIKNRKQTKAAEESPAPEEIK